MNKIQTKYYNNVEDFFDDISPWKQKISLDGYIFRGHSQENYELIPSALRKDNLDLLWEIANLKPVKEQENYIHWQIMAEYSALRNFYNLADRKGLEVPQLNKFRWSLANTPDAFINMHIEEEKQWLSPKFFEIAALAQHYGVPTRLLDWSYDIFVAMYFAFHGAFDKNGDMVIWALNKNELRLMNTMNTQFNIDFITPHYASNPNLNAQKGLFTHIPSLNQSSDEIFEALGNKINVKETDRIALDKSTLDSITSNSSDKTLLMKFIIPCSEAKKGAMILDKMGYDTAKIYPGYGGVAKQLIEQTKYFNRDKNDLFIGEAV